ncbi:PAS domain-containing protein [Salipiger sp. P9]|uniref:PAS domain-containing protein n=1 Tax=Salipiger pentaromativorans TaxID=2943193 RepID=UPI0021575762|nr:PAS domain-containing protein [Salipiger pentaromativorans]MCR8546906.1 PAS domain-containing protein [Salipiger pentaromativorans]
MSVRTTDQTEMTDILTREGRVAQICAAQEAVLGTAPGALAGADWSRIYRLPARERLEELFGQPDAGPHLVALEMRRDDGTLLPVTAVVTRISHPDHGICLRTVKWRSSGMLENAASLAEENEVISSILAASDDAGWCMEWAEPVDLSAPEQEIIRQVFENGPRWRFCNDAMARLYRTPEGADFNALPVHETFPRSPENEEFVHRLVQANFDVNGSPSRDLRYDGVWIEVENDVRGHIRGNRLYRMWGTVRDVSKHARRAAVLREEIETLEAILAALPDAVLVVDGEGHLLRANLAAEELFDLSPDLLPGRSLTDLVDLPMALSALFATAAERLPGHPVSTIAVGLRTPSQSFRADLAARPLSLRGTECLVLSLRARLGISGTGAPPLRARG